MDRQLQEPPRAVRRGITLMEVLISIGVLSIGLLGVAALMPMAMYKSQQGSSNDRKSLVGRRAFREFRIREMHNPGTATNPRWLAPSPADANNYVSLVFNANGRFRQQAYCLDPYYLAASDPANLQYFGAFPGDPNADVGCFRVSLARQGTLGNVNAVNQATTDALNLALDFREASAVFVGEDDLEVEIPKTVEQPVVSSTLQDSANPNNVVKRYAHGRYSWMATLVPQRRKHSIILPVPPNDLYIVSIVVFQNRMLPPALGASETQTRAINGLYSGGVSGGDLQLSGNIAGMRVGDWALLGADTGTSAYLRWYRVVGVDNPADAGQPDQDQNVTLLGPDWYSDASETQFTWVPNVVAVYEKTMRIKTRGY